MIADLTRALVLERIRQQAGCRSIDEATCLACLKLTEDDITAIVASIEADYGVRIYDRYVHDVRGLVEMILAGDPA